MLKPKTGEEENRHLTNAEVELRELAAENHDATIAELCELSAVKTGNWVSRTAMCRTPQKKLGLNRKKHWWRKYITQESKPQSRIMEKKSER